MENGLKEVLKMTQKFLMMENNTRFITFIALLLFTISGYTQCWNNDSISNGFKINDVFVIDSLSIVKSATNMLDHSISLIDSIDVNQKNTWLYYVIVLDDAYDNKSGSQINVELKQGVNYNISMFFLPGEGDEFLGAFCYKGYTFFVLCENRDYTVFKELFKLGEKHKFPIYYKSPEISKVWKDIEPEYKEKYIFMFYRYKNGKFTYSATNYFL